MTAVRQILNLLVNRAKASKVLVDVHYNYVRQHAFAPEHRWLSQGVALPRGERDASRNKLIDERNHEPIVGVVLVINLLAELITAAGNLLKRASTDVQHVHRSVSQDDEQVAEAGHDPERKFPWKQPRPILKALAPVDAGVIKRVILQVQDRIPFVA
jgi:hypothetical protein